MRISRRTSGGRGEYEISEASAEGLTPTELLHRRLVLDFGAGWRIDSGTHLTRQGGKRRIRLLPGTEIHLHLQIAAALLLPHPVRADEALGRGAPVAKTGQYAVEHIRLGRVRLQGQSEAILAIEEIELRNRSYDAEELGFRARIRDLRRVWTHADNFPAEVAELLDAHREIATGGGPVPQEAERIVSNLQRVVSQTAQDFGIVYYDGGTDVLEPLLNSIGSEPPPPIAVNAVDPDDVEIRRRTAKEWKRWANARGSASARFRHAVRQAYNYTCVFCGAHLPATRYNNAGVDAAHILPWAEYDLDQIANGLCLCRHHHWAFDEGLIVMRYRDGNYFLEVPENIVRDLTAEGDFSLDELLSCQGQVPQNRLPRRADQRPHPQFLEALNAVT